MSAARFDESVPREPQQPARRAFAAAVVLAGALSCAPVLADDVQATRYQILTLQSADLYLPAFVLLDQATRSELQARLGQRAEFHVEALDILRNPREQSEPEMVAFLRNKYQGVKIDVVVATETAALEFADRHGGEL